MAQKFSQRTAAHSSAQQRTAAHSSAQQRTAAHSSANNTYVTDNTYVGEFHDILAQPPPEGGLVVVRWPVVFGQDSTNPAV